MLGVEVREGESIESALKRFKKECERDGVLTDYRRHERYEKPSERRKKKAAAAKRKLEKKLKKLKKMQRYI